MTWTHAVTGAALLGALLGSLIDHAISTIRNSGQEHCDVRVRGIVHDGKA